MVNSLIIKTQWIWRQRSCGYLVDHVMSYTTFLSTSDAQVHSYGMQLELLCASFTELIKPQGARVVSLSCKQAITGEAALMVHAKNYLTNLAYICTQLLYNN